MDSFLNQYSETFTKELEMFGITEETVRQRTEEPPYQAVIDNLRKVVEMSAPIDKMRVIAQSSSLIVACVDKFWEDVIYKLDRKKDLTLDADSLLMIFIYVTFKAEISQMYAHLKMANQFATPSLKQSKLGYYTSTMEVSLEQVICFEED